MATRGSHRFEYHRFRRGRGVGAPRPAGQRDAARGSDALPTDGAGVSAEVVNSPTVEAGLSQLSKTTAESVPSGDSQRGIGRGRGRGGGAPRRPRVFKSFNSNGDATPAETINSPPVQADSSQVPPATSTPLPSDDLQKSVSNGRGRGRGSGAPRRPRTCKYFIADGYCYFGDECRFYHPRNPAIRPAPRPSQPAAKPVARPNQAVLSSDLLNSEEQVTVRRSEIAALKRRFPTHRAVPSNEQDADTFLFDFTASDPDWPFDVKTVGLKATFPAGYPINPAMIEAADANLPDLVVRALSAAIGEWLQTTYEQQLLKNAFEPVMRTFLRWFDRSVLTLFIEGLRKTKMVVDAQSAGISLAVLPKTQPAPAASTTTVAEETDTQQSEATELESPTQSSPTQSSPPPETSTAKVSESDVSDKLSSLTFSSEKVAGSTEIRLTSCVMGENVACLTPIRLTLSVQCIRCPTHGEMVVKSGVKTTTSSCSRCSTKWSINWLPGMVHATSVVLGQLIPTGCRPVDLVLVTSEFKLTCLSCNKDMMLKSISYGAPFKTWCQGCHTKSELGINAVRFHSDTPLEGNTGAAAAAIKPVKKKTVLGPRIVEGEPLPDNGTCKHYKKSFRWFRFPCCGKVYPCDLCHEENETHEMKFANRIVCGFCSKEQPYQTSKVCSSCKGSVVKAKTVHWEGGKGCRDSVKMAKGDDRKYSNSRLKTVSRRKQSELATKDKKKKDD
uniref:Nucleoporin NUP42 n=1 Tax=Plectus sambesii TaxID=2011161 RepID=A0A914UZC8_9BILA